ncbi:ATP synthase subunit 5 [Endocarpon pusillum Z07020]|uniref:ATP synthase subunit 5, mitochondrial n=1 Tax=Endocarpon pusillum (strain Z07020 / HMAS-L-300199) TaxID=1263415 RepID=U1FZB7_ENDPU|nr:ATP synthase subunit 5 [Endocarpon pusillum Z07020]ERF70277.1 ATP synthase subunit 5 [Endocarpon pusillum Z07020]
MTIETLFRQLAPAGELQNLNRAVPIWSGNSQLTPIARRITIEIIHIHSNSARYAASSPCQMMSSRLARPALAATTRQAPRCATRSYAAAASSIDPKPPVPLFGVDGTYASALYTAAAKSSSLDSIAKSLTSLHQVLKSDAKLSPILHAPTLTDADKSAIIAELEKHTGGGDKQGTMKNFLQTLAENNRLGLLEGVCEKFAELMSAYRGEMELVITSAQKLEDRVVRRLEAAIAKSEYSHGKKIKVVTKVNPEILGGLVVEIGDRTIDYSVSAKIAKLNKLLTDTV